jgi:ribonuclease HI
MVHDETREATIHPPLATSSNHPVPSVAKRLASIAVVQRIGIATRVVRQDLIGWASTCGVLSAEIAAISAALEYALEHLKPPSRRATLELMVFSDSHYALLAIQAGNDARTGRALLGRIPESIEALSEAGIEVRFRWSPGHEGVVGNEEANDAAREASSQEGRPTVPAQERVREVAGVIRLINRDRSENPTPLTLRGCRINTRGRWTKPYRGSTPYSCMGHLPRIRRPSLSKLEQDIVG